MKKRIRKKLHVKEFAEYGIAFMVKSTRETGHEILEKAIDAAAKFGLSCWGGGEGYFSMPEADPNYTLPKFVEEVAMCSALGVEPGTMIFCIMSIDKNPIPEAAAEEVRKVFAEEVYGLKINPRVNLWPRV